MEPDGGWRVDEMAKLCQRWQAPERPEAYLRTALVNACNNWHRANQTRRAKLPLVATSDRIDFAADHLADAIARLPFRQRAVIVLRYYADLPEQGAAQRQFDPG
jgi:DNA-directed RNA polymerase specialized sigma24 family protein